MTSVKKLFAWLLSAVLLLLSLVICVLVIAIKSETLSLWALQQAVLYANDNTAMEIDFSSATGTLERGFRLQDFHLALADDGGTLALEDVNLEWDLWALVSKEVVIERIEFSALSFVAGNQTQSDASEPTDLRAIFDSLFALPVDIRLRSLTGSQLTYTDSAQTQEIDELQLALRINENEFHITDLLVEMQGVRLESSSLALNRQLQVAGNLDWHLALFEPELSGSLVVDGDLETLGVEHQLHQPVTLNSRGSVVTGIFEPAQFSFQLEHSLPEFSPEAFPQLAGQDWLLGISGNFITRGDLENVAVESTFQAGLRDMGVFDITLDAVYQNQQISITRLQANSQFGELNVAGDVVLAPDMDIALDWQFQSVEVPMLPADISVTELDAAGQLQMTILGDDVQGRLELDQVVATLNDYPLQVSGHAEVSDQALTDLELLLDAGSNTLQIQGRAGSELDLQWALTAPALEVLLPGLSGELNGSGIVSGSTEAPSVYGDIDAHSLQYASEDLALSATVLNLTASYQPDVMTASLTSGALTYRAESMSLNTAGISLEASYRPEAVSLDLLLTELALQSADYSRTLDMIQLDVSGLAEDHNLALDIKGPGLTFDMNAEGTLVGERWDGVVQSALLSSRFSDLELREPISLQVDSSQVNVSEHCWLLDRATLCPTVQWQSDTGAAGEISLSDLPLSYLTRRGVLENINAPDIRRLLDQKPEGLNELQEAYGIFLPANSYIRGELSALLSFSGLGLDEASRMLELSLQPDSLMLGIVSSDLAENMTQAPEIREFSIVNPVWEASLSGADLATRFDFDIYEVSENEQALQGNFSSSIGLSGTEELSGDLALDFPQMNWLETLLPQVRDTQGRLDLDARLTGNLERPLLQTTAMFREGSFQVPELGLSVNNVEFDVSSDEDNNFTLALKGESGAGLLDIAGHLYHPFQEQSREMALDIRGDSFQVMNQSGAIVHISPELMLTFEAGAVAVDGELLVPVFDLIAEEAIDTTGASAVNVSRDVVIIRDADAGTAVSRSGDMESIPMEIAVELILGEDVRLRAYGLDLELEGAVSVEQAAGRPLLMYGEVGITEGYYEIYGQRLTVERGQLLFLGNPANPALEIRASRTVDTSTVGIQMNGTLNNIQGRLYSVPTYPESEILAMLVTGRSFGNSEPVDSDRLLATIANLGIERGQGITNAIQTGLGLDTIEVTGGTNLEDSSLGVGKYITPELFMRYDVGLFHRESVLTMIYTLSERLRLELETGISQSVDLTYTVEK